MGLDMYLSTEVYIGGWEHGSNEERKRYRQGLELAGLPRDFTCDGSPSLTINVNVAYWRKANQIHQWFVANAQEGVDDCKSYYVSREQLTELRDTAQKVLDSTELHDGLVANGYTFGEDGEKRPILEEGKMVVNSSVAEALLPSAAGFFFGSTDYDEYYVSDLCETVEQIDRALAIDGADFYYRSSW